MPRRYGLALIVVLLSNVPAAFASDREQIVAKTETFLSAYASGDVASVMRQVDPIRITAYGSDLAEYYVGAHAVEQMMRNDLKLWGGPASISGLRDISVVIKGSLATVFFNASFHTNGGPTIPVRFSMTWRRSKGGWMLLQSSNSTITVMRAAEPLPANPTK